MREDRPLDALFPELSEDAQIGAAERAVSGDAAGPVAHPRVLEVELDREVEWVIGSWRAEDVARAVSALVEASLLQAMSKPPAYAGGQERVIAGVRLFMFEAPDTAQAEALQALGFVQDQYQPDAQHVRLSALKAEADGGGWSSPARPASVWWAPFGRPDSALAQRLSRAHELAADALGVQVWGQTPGAVSRAVADALATVCQLQLKPDLDSLHQLDMLLIDRQPGRWRWLSPVLFQGLCDFVGIVAIASLQKRVQWGVASADGQGDYHAPLLRVMTTRGPVDVPIAARLLRLVCRPVAAPEEVALLRDWLLTALD